MRRGKPSLTITLDALHGKAPLIGSYCSTFICNLLLHNSGEIVVSIEDKNKRKVICLTQNTGFTCSVSSSTFITSSVGCDLLHTSRT